MLTYTCLHTPNATSNPSASSDADAGCNHEQPHSVHGSRCHWPQGDPAPKCTHTYPPQDALGTLHGARISSAASSPAAADREMLTLIYTRRGPRCTYADTPIGVPSAPGLRRQLQFERSDLGALGSGHGGRTCAQWRRGCGPLAPQAVCKSALTGIRMASPTDSTAAGCWCPPASAPLPVPSRSCLQTLIAPRVRLTTAPSAVRLAPAGAVADDTHGQDVSQCGGRREA